MPAPIDFYAWTTPNGFKVAIALEEMELPYTVRPVNIGRGEQTRPEYLAINPNNKIPAITDPDGPGGKPLTLFESGAILVYLAEKTGRFRPADPTDWYRHIQWLMWQMAGVGPMIGQYGHFTLHAKEGNPAAEQRYGEEMRRLARVADTRLGEAEYLAGEYGIADMATWPWIKMAGKLGLELDDHPNLKRWLDAVGERPAVRRGVALSVA
ncbi:MAG TPA: glutathione S-transferase N-terminal domain-containing protein [Azospirillaceae bacterium]|nr:glutathione S-transferase N-terminal domain-containing protein [Azospirillaceae bacterium]